MIPVFGVGVVTSVGMSKSHHCRRGSGGRSRNRSAHEFVPLVVY